MLKKSRVKRKTNRNSGKSDKTEIIRRVCLLEVATDYCRGVAVRMGGVLYKLG